jgi:hypothetical protein
MKSEPSRRCFGFRVLTKSLAFTATAALLQAPGIEANTTALATTRLIAGLL